MISKHMDHQRKYKSIFLCEYSDTCGRHAKSAMSNKNKMQAMCVFEFSSSLIFFK